MDQFKVILGKDCLEENYGKLLLDSAENANVQITAGFLTAVMSPHQCPFFFFFFFFNGHLKRRTGYSYHNFHNSHNLLLATTIFPAK